MQLMHSHLFREEQGIGRLQVPALTAQAAVVPSTQHCVVAKRLLTKQRLPNYGTRPPEEVLVDRAGCGDAAAEVARAQQGQRVFAGIRVGLTLGIPQIP